MRPLGMLVHVVSGSHPPLSTRHSLTSVGEDEGLLEGLGVGEDVGLSVGDGALLGLAVGESDGAFVEDQLGL